MLQALKRYTFNLAYQTLTYSFLFKTCIVNSGKMDVTPKPIVTLHYHVSQ